MDPNRRPDIDWLRIFATYLLFVFHVGKVFDPAPFYHIRNADLSFTMLVFCGFVSLWHMPLFFLLAGWSACASLQRRGVRAFATERVLRLGVPLVVGCVLLAPVFKFFELRSGLDLYHRGLRVAPALQDGFRLVIPGGLPVAEPFHEDFLTFLPTFFARLDRFTWGHLWFLAYLFTFTMVYLPAFLWLVRRQERVANVPSWVVYLPVIPLAVIQLTLRNRWPGIYNLYDDWANVAYYSIFFAAGFVLALQPALEGAVGREWKRSLAVGVGVSLVLLLAVLGVVSSTAVLLVGSAVAGWCFVVALLGFARRSLTVTSPALGYLSESAFPVYILHQTAIIVPGYFLIQLPFGVTAKFALLLLVSVIITLAVYHSLVRPFAVPRFLLGMRPAACRRRRPVAASRSVAATLLLLGLVVAPASAATPVGRWYAEGGAAEVAVEPCGAALCARVVWLRSPLDEDGCELRDRNNPDPALRRRPVAGLEILRGLTRSAGGTWSGGEIYDPTTGNTYACRLTLDGEDRLRLRGYIGVPLLGRTATWTRVGAEKRLCRDDGR